MRDDEKPKVIRDHPLTQGDVIGTALSKIFPAWSSTRISRWLGVNPRTVQRWLSAGHGEFLDEKIPPDVAGKILETATHIENIDLGGQLDRWIYMQLDEKPNGNHVDKEILGAYLADRYKKMMGRDID